MHPQLSNLHLRDQETISFSPNLLTHDDRAKKKVYLLFENVSRLREAFIMRGCLL